MQNSKYLPKLKRNKTRGDGRQGRFVDPSMWKTGPDEFTREKYYAYLKHKAQCKFRNEQYELTWDDWQVLWTDDLFARRGRGVKDLCLCRADWDGVWKLDNCIIQTRRQHFEQKTGKKKIQ